MGIVQRDGPVTDPLPLSSPSQAPQSLLLSCVKTWKFIENLWVYKWKCHLLRDDFPDRSSKIVFPYYSLSLFLHFFPFLQSIYRKLYLSVCLSVIYLTIFSTCNPHKKVLTRYFNFFFFRAKCWKSGVYFPFAAHFNFHWPLCSAQGPHVADGCHIGWGSSNA